MKAKAMAMVLAFGFFLAGRAHGGFVLPIDVDGADDGPITYNPGFSFGGDTTTASTSVASSAFGLPPGDSIFGGDGTAQPDTYIYTYSPDSQSDNLAIPAGTDLGNGVLATGVPGGGPGTYNVYATWPSTTNVSGGLITYTISTAGDNEVLQLDQNNTGDIWIPLGSIDYASGPITVTQEAGANTFVSMRAAGVLFESTARGQQDVPEPATTALLALAAAGLAGYVHRRRTA